jgi:hypothetical protein
MPARRRASAPPAASEAPRLARTWNSTTMIVLRITIAEYTATGALVRCAIQMGSTTVSRLSFIMSSALTRAKAANGRSRSSAWSAVLMKTAGGGCEVQDRWRG